MSASECTLLAGRLRVELEIRLRKRGIDPADVLPPPEAEGVTEAQLIAELDRRRKRRPGWPPDS